jgi:hypothetical protein
MQAHADALPQSLELAGEERGRHPVVRSGRGNGEFHQREIRRDASATYDQTGIIVVASAWLAFYVAAVIHLL